MVASGNLGSSFPQQATGYALEAVDQLGEGDLRRVVDEQVDVIVLAAALDQLRLEVAAHLGKDAVQVADGEVGQHVSAVFGDKDQMDMQHVDDMPACAILHC